MTTTLPASLRRTLPGSSYTDPAGFAAEQERIFERRWFCVCRGADLPTPGAFRTFQVGREPVLATRSRTGEVRAFLNVCRHRGAQLCASESGELHRAIRCTYHAWTYDFDGNLIAAPNMADMPDLEKRSFGLNRLHVREWLGYVWVCLADQPPSFEEQVQGAVVTRLGDLESIDHYDVAHLALARRIRYDVAANWKLIVENFMECYHCATIHPELVEVLPEFAKGYAAQYYVGHGALFGDEIHGFTVDGSAGQQVIPTLAAEQQRRYFAVTVRPQVFINLVPDHVILHRMFPLAVDRTVVECDWLFLPGVVESGADVSLGVELFDRVNQQDFEACERTQVGMGSRAYRDGGVLVPSEHHIGDFHEWVAHALDGAASPVSPGGPAGG
ncbi:MAG TPA: aromatic ring-hydroxylating dioxygenase subunit alpha [Rugosimonospora sp.]|nr:aromatic ring-hydroxylating dioxygenase subunit alpha [Rugosimonospora sp.]